MPKPNYAFEKRQRELEKKRKKEDKAQKKSVPSAPAGGPPRSAQEAEGPVSAANDAAPG